MNVAVALATLQGALPANSSAGNIRNIPPPAKRFGYAPPIRAASERRIQVMIEGGSKNLQSYQAALRIGGITMKSVVDKTFNEPRS